MIYPHVKPSDCSIHGASFACVKLGNGARQGVKSAHP